jgi:hypothetical protein
MGNRRRKMETQPLNQFADQIESELQQLDEELIQEKATCWEKKLGGKVAALRHNPGELMSCLLSEDWELRELAIQMLATFHWQGIVPGLVRYVARHDPHEHVRCAAIEEIGCRLSLSRESALRASLAELILHSTCKVTVLTAYLQFVASLPLSLEEMRGISKLTYEVINWDLVRQHLEIHPIQE